MKKSSLFVLASIVVVLGVIVGVLAARIFTQRRTTITILHVNDSHSYMEPIRTGEYAGWGGDLERAAYIDSVRAADGRDNVLLLHAGDFWQGTSYFTEFGGTVEIQAMNAVGYDAVTLGNHEFDNGLEALGERLASLECPVVVCNYDFSPFEMGKYIKPYVIVEKAGKKIGIIGVLCKLKDMVAGDIADRVPSFDMIPTVQKYADQLHEECDLVIALTHIGYTEHNPGDVTDPMLVAATRNIDLVIGGHSHTFLEEPDWVKNLDGKRVPIVQTGWMGAYMGEFKVKL
ncbi:MAG: metallophosphoesterase [Bacteroidales bacterium]|nr:metallophosphoesterase [Bacteroidales bacterium]